MVILITRIKLNTVKDSHIDDTKTHFYFECLKLVGKNHGLLISSKN